MTEKVQRLLERAEAWTAAHRAEYIEELQGFARIPSVSRADLAEPGAPFGPDCRRVLEHALSRGAHYGFATADHDGYAASITLGDGENALGVVAHLDVVPEGIDWVYPPYGATYLPEHGVLVGRGVSDNKSAAVAGLFAMRMLREFGVPMKHGVTLLCGTSEETGMQDMRHLASIGFRFPQTSLVPDASFPVNYAQKGNVDALIAYPCEGNLLAFDAGTVRNAVPAQAVCVVDAPAEAVRSALSGLEEAEAAQLTIEEAGTGTRITAAGKAGHAAFPQGGDSAIRRLTKALVQSDLLTGSSARAIAELADLTDDAFGYSEGVACTDEASGDLTLVYGVAHLKDGTLTVSVDSRYPVTCDGEKLGASLCADWTRRGFAVTALDVAKPFYIPKDDPRVTALMSLYKDMTGRDDPPYAMGGGTYSREVPGAITFGPGIPGDRPDWSAFLPAGHGGAHGPDETVSVEKLLFCSKMYVLALAMLDEVVD